MYGFYLMYLLSLFACGSKILFLLQFIFVLHEREKRTIAGMILSIDKLADDAG